MITVINRTPFVVSSREGGHPPATFSVLNPEPWSWAVQVVVKATFDVANSRAILASEQLPIVDRSEQTDAGYIEGDLAFEKDGVDLVVLAAAHAPRGVAVREMHVGLSLGDVSQIYSVAGERVWTKQDGSWKPTDPVPFTSMGLGYDHAFGGTYKFERGNEIPYTRNPVGKGWTPNMSGIEFEGRPLANLEHAHLRVISPEEEPDPAGLGWYKMDWALRMMPGVKLRKSGPPEVLPRLWNAAHPDLILREDPGGKLLRLEGMTGDGLMELEIPRLPIAIEHTLSGHSESLPAKPDTFCILPSRASMFVLARWLVPFNRADDLADAVIHIVPESGAAALGAR